MRRWVGQPGMNAAALERVGPEAVRLQTAFEAIEELGDDRACRICGVVAPLTIEHTPSKAAGNRGPLFAGRIDDAATTESGRLTWSSEHVAAATHVTLCAACNSNTGSWYNPAYIRLVAACQSLAAPENAARHCELDLELHPQRAAKQALASLAAVSQPGLTERLPQLRALLVGKEAQGPIAPARLWLYLRANRGGRASGITVSLDVARGVGCLLAEWSFWPLGWLLTLDGSDVPNALDVSAWLDHGYHEKAARRLTVPCHWALTAYPGDFRSRDQIMQQAGDAERRARE